MSESIRQRVLDARGFVLPDAYVALHNLGRLQFGEDRDDWEANWQTIEATRPPALSCTPWFLNVQWEPVDALVEWRSPDYWLPNEFICFAGNGYGDEWVWDPTRSHPAGTPIILCRHDENEAEIFAATFNDFLYRMLLESLSCISYDDRDSLELDDEGYRHYLALHVELIAPFISDRQLATLSSALRNDFADDTENEQYYLLSGEKKAKLIASDMASYGVGTKFGHLIR